MTICTEEVALNRIALSPANSPLAVFKDGNKLDVMFANTVVTQRAIENKDAYYIGSYSKENDPIRIKREIKTFINAYNKKYKG